MRKHLRWMLLLLIGAMTGTYVEGSQRGKELLEELKRQEFQGVEELSEKDIQTIRDFKEAQEAHSTHKALQQAKADLYSLLLGAAPKVSDGVLLDRRLSGYRPISKENIRWLVDHNVIDNTGQWIGGLIVLDEWDRIENERGVQLDPQGRPMKLRLKVCRVEVKEAFLKPPRNKPQVDWLVRNKKGDLWAIRNAVDLLPESHPHCQFAR